MFPLFALALKAFIFFLMALAAAHAWCEHHQKLLGVRRLGGPKGFTMGDANVRSPVATRFEHGVGFGLLVHKSPFMADKRDPLVLSNYIFELLEVISIPVLIYPSQTLYLFRRTRSKRAKQALT